VKGKGEFLFRPIGILHTPYRSKSGVPIQGVFDPGSRGRAEIFEAYEPGLKDVEGFSHLILLYVFDQSQGYDLVVAHGSQYGSSLKEIAPDFKTTAFAHGTDWYSNELIIEDDLGIRVPIVLFVEEGKHATCPDRNADGIYTPGYDVNVRINDAWGVRDVFGSGWLIDPSFNSAMFKPRWPQFAVLPPESSQACHAHTFFSSIPKDDPSYGEILGRYELRPANTVVMCDDVPPDREFLLGMMTRRIGAQAMKSGVIIGILTNICFWLLTPISWLWRKCKGIEPSCEGFNPAHRI